jgi:UDP-3-O-[3-hydroxymyristoyl] glucosamine N-acyltransferase
MTLGEIAKLVGGELHGPQELPISGPGSLDTESTGRILFAVSADFLKQAEASDAAAILLPRELNSGTKPYIKVDDPRRAFMVLLHGAARPLPLSPGIHPTAVVDSGAVVSSQAQIGAYAVVERGAHIEAGCRIYPFAYIGEDCVVEEGVIVYPHAVLYQQVRVGRGSIIHAGAVLGADGFGFVWDGKQRVKVPQIGNVAVADNCEIGALTTVDRAMVGDTKVGEGTKLDNHVHIGHNVVVGEHCALAAFVGVGGSTTIGDRVLIGGQTGISDHVTIASDVILAGQAGATNDIKEAGEYMGMPARPSAMVRRSIVLFLKLPELFSRVRKLEERARKE